MREFYARGVIFLAEHATFFIQLLTQNTYFIRIYLFCISVAQCFCYIIEEKDLHRINSGKNE